MSEALTLCFFNSSQIHLLILPSVLLVVIICKSFPFSIVIPLPILNFAFRLLITGSPCFPNLKRIVLLVSEAFMDCSYFHESPGQTTVIFGIHRIIAISSIECIGVPVRMKIRLQHLQCEHLCSCMPHVNPYLFIWPHYNEWHYCINVWNHTA